MQQPVALNAFSLDAALFTQNVSNNYSTDDDLLHAMRDVMQTYVLCSEEGRLAPEVKLMIQQRYEAFRDQLKDSMLKEFAAFEVMERLYTREYREFS